MIDSPLFAETAPSTVPLNEEEVAGQLALANLDDSPDPLDVRVPRALSQLRSEGTDGAYAAAEAKAREEEMAAKKKVAETLAATGQTTPLERLARNIAESEAWGSVPDKVEGAKQTVARAVENVVLSDADAYAEALNNPNFNPVKDALVEQAAMKNLVAESLAKAGKDVKWYHYLNYLGSEFVGGLQHMNRHQEMSAMSKALNLPYTIDKVGMLEQAHAIFANLPPEARPAVVAELRKHIPNPVHFQSLLNELASPNLAMSRLEQVFDVVSIADPFLILVGVGRMLAGGKSLNALASVGGTKLAGQKAAEDLLMGGKISGLTKNELISQALAAGQSPLHVGHPSLQGMAPAMQETIAARVNELYSNLRDRLSSSGVADEEVKAEMARLRATLSPETNKAVAKVLFGKADSSGIDNVVFWQDPRTGRAFGSKEAAERYIRDNGLLDAKVVDDSVLKNSAPVPVEHRTIHGGSDFDELKAAFVGSGEGWHSMGWGFYSTKGREFAKSYADRYGGLSPAVHDVDTPNYDKLMNWDKEVSKQPALAKALSHLLDTEDVVALNAKGAHGSDAYWKVVEKMDGDQAKASAAFDKWGIEGAYTDRAGTSRREFVTYNLDKVKLEGKTLLDRAQLDKEAIAKRTAMSDDDAAEEALDIAYEELMGLGVKESIAVADKAAMTKAMQPGPAYRGVVPGNAFDNGQPLFANGKTLEVTGSFGKDAAKVIEDLKNRIGLKDHKLVVAEASASDLNRLRAYFPQLDTMLSGYEMKWKLGKGPNAFYYSINSNLSLIVQSTGSIRGGGSRGINRLAFWNTMSHEMGHMFQFAILRNQLKDSAFVQQLMHEFASFVKGRGDDMGFLAAYRTWDKAEIDHFLKHGIGGAQQRAGVELANNAKWYSMLDEYFAEQFSKWVVTKPDTLLERTFKYIATQLQELARYVTNTLGSSKMLDTILPKDFVAKFMDEHVSMVANGQFTYRQSTLSVQEVYNQSGGIHRVYPASPLPSGAPKPRIKLKVPAGAYYIMQTNKTPISYGAVGKYTDKDIASMPVLAVDPKHAASEFAVETRVVGVHAEAKMKNDLAAFIRPFYNALDAKSKARVKAVLEEGDAFSNAGSTTGKEFTYMELRAKELTEPEIAAYFATRQLRQTMWHVRNGELVRHMRAKGMKEVEVAGVKAAGYVYNTAPEALGKWVNTSIYSVADGKFVYLRAEDMERAYAAGSKLVKFDSPIEIGGKNYSVLLVNNTNSKVREVTVALNYRPGEFARIYSDEYFITRTMSKEVDGVMKEVTETVRTAASAREAGEFTAAVSKVVTALKSATPPSKEVVEQLVGKYFNVDKFMREVAEGGWDGFKGLDFHYTRNKDEYLNGVLAEHTYTGRLFTDKRGEKLLSTDASRVNTLDVFESLQAEMSNISRVANISEWRETQVRRWMNTFGHLLPTRTGDDVADFFAAAGATFTGGSGKQALFAERTHNYIMRQIGMRTKEEQFYNTITRRWTESFLTGNTTIEKVGAALRKADFLGFLRTVNFNFNLGMFNPAQLIVQANGAATAVILSPVKGVAAVKTVPLLRMALMSDNPDVWRKLATVDKLSNIGLSSEQEFVELVQAVRKSGLIANTKSTALHNLEDGKFDIFASYPSKITKQHTFFFNRGEEFSRLVAFDVARREWQDANKGSILGEDALRAILVRADDFTQNMTKANLARWQEGALSIPMQFAQYNIKLAANVFSAFLSQGRGFTKTEALTLMAGHVLFYGAAGTGLSWLVDEVLPDEAKAGMSQTAKATIAQGLFSGLIHAVTESNIAIGTRLGSFDYYQRIANALYKDPASVYQALLGPTLGTAKRLGVIGDVAYLWYVDPEVSAKDVVYGLSKMSTEQVATLRNAAKAYLYMQHQNKLLDSRGVALGDLTPGEILGQALGFQPTLAVDVHNLIKSKKDHNEAMDDIAKLIFSTQKAIMRAYDRGDVEYAEEQKRLLVSLWPANAGDLMDVQRRVRDRLFPYDTEMQKLLGDYVMKGMRYPLPLTPTTEPKK